jgi:phage shock protein PspC (stress-responsive transcriptional regulator)
MNGNRLYRSTSEAILGGVASGLGNYLKIDPTIVRVAFAVGTLFTGGFLLFAYIALWLLIPTAGSTAPTPGDVVRENLDDIGSRVRSGFNGGNGGPAPTSGGNGNGHTNGAPAGASNGTPNGGQQVQFQAGSRQNHSVLPMILIGVGAFFLLSKIGFFHFLGSAFLPLVLIGFGLYLLSRRRA